MGIWKTMRDTHEIFRLYGKPGSPRKNMMPDFTPERAKYPKSSPKPRSSPKWGSQKLHKICTKFCCLIRKLGSGCKNVTSDFVPEVTTYPKSSPKCTKIADNGSQK